MRVKMLTTAAGPDGVFPVGAVVDIDDKLAKAFIAGDYAEMLDKPTFEAAVIDTPEKAVLPTPKRKAVR